MFSFPSPLYLPSLFLFSCASLEFIQRQLVARVEVQWREERDELWSPVGLVWILGFATHETRELGASDLRSPQRVCPTGAGE